MADDKTAMPADGSGTRDRAADGNGELASRRDGDSAASANPGESGGGPYPNPHSGASDDGFDGGQSGSEYYGGGQRGEDGCAASDNAQRRDR